MIQMAYIGYIATGATLPADLALAGYLAVALTMISGQPPSAGITFAVALGLLGLFIRQAKLTINSLWVHKADAYAEKGDTRGIILMNIGASQIVPFALYFIPTFLAIYVGGDYLKQLLDSLPKEVVDGLRVTGGLLSALGLGLLLKYLSRGYLLPFLFLGFAMAAYGKLDILAVSIIGTALAFFTCNLSVWDWRSEKWQTTLRKKWLSLKGIWSNRSCAGTAFASPATIMNACKHWVLHMQ